MKITVKLNEQGVSNINCLPVRRPQPVGRNAQYRHSSLQFYFSPASLLICLLPPVEELRSIVETSAGSQALVVDGDLQACVSLRRCITGCTEITRAALFFFLSLLRSR